MTGSLARAARLAQIGVGAIVDDAIRAGELPGRMRLPVQLYLLVNGCNLPGATVASIAGCTRQNVSKHIARVEDLRDQPSFERVLTSIETRLFGER